MGANVGNICKSVLSGLWKYSKGCSWSFLGSRFFGYKFTTQDFFDPSKITLTYRYKNLTIDIASNFHNNSLIVNSKKSTSGVGLTAPEMHPSPLSPR